jgi:hypothetical protein
MAVSRGEAAVTREIIDQIRSWMPVAAAIA